MKQKPHGSEIVINEYQGVSAQAKQLIKNAFPTIYEKYLKQIHLRIIDHRHEPVLREYVNRIMHEKPFPLFSYVEIETINRCNNNCSFCPANRNEDKRPFMLMDRRLFVSIIEQLRELRYSKIIGIFSNNEPLLDDRLAEFCRMAREACPKAHLLIMTNGLLLTVPKLDILMKYLDKIIIDNYDDDLKFTKQTQEIYDHCVKNNLYKDKIIIFLRKKNEILTNRAGQAHNRTRLRIPLRTPCAYPFTQFVIRPDGKVSLCCNDAMGQMTMGDLNREKIVDIWNGNNFRSIREGLMHSRQSIRMCSMCDSGFL